MPVSAQTYPALGKVTVFDEDVVDLTAILEVPHTQTGSCPAWEASLWHSVDGAAEWSESRLGPSVDSSEPCVLHPKDALTRRLYFRSSLRFAYCLKFTLKYRSNPTADWTWIRDELNIKDGLAIKRSSTSASDDINVLLRGLGEEWEVEKRPSDAASLWVLRAEVPRPCLGRGGSDGDASTIRDFELGLPRQTTLRWFALVRQSPSWLAPRHGQSHLTFDKDAVLCAFLLANGRNAVFFAASGLNNVMSVFRSRHDGILSVHARSDGSGACSERATVLVAESCHIEQAIAEIMAFVRMQHDGSRRIPKKHQAEEALLHDRTSKSTNRDTWHDGLGFCTWNSLGQDLTEARLVEVLDDLTSHNIQITNLIIDDGWQQISDGGTPFSKELIDFEAAAKGFPSGLKATVASIKHKHRHIRHVAVWHALLGYWSGIDPKGRLGTEYASQTLARRDDHLGLHGDMTVVAESDLTRFFADFYGFLQEAGIDAVKTDVQSMVECWRSATARRGLLYSYIDTWSLAALRHFEMRTISCMSMFPQALSYAHASYNRPIYPMRTSDDYFPDEPDSHTWHIWTNAHNCVLLREMNVLPDWDMFQTAHEYAGFHAAGRCISGGPIYITDKLGQHDLELIYQISAKTPQNGTTTLRPSGTARAIDPFAGYEDIALLKVGNRIDNSDSKISILGLFNVSGRRITELVALSDFPGVEEDKTYIVRSHRSGLTSNPKCAKEAHDLCDVTIDAKQWDILSAYPLVSLASTDNLRIRIANLGLVDKMTGSAAVLHTCFASATDGRIEMTTTLKALGMLGVYVSCPSHVNISENLTVKLGGLRLPLGFVHFATQNSVLEIDIQRAWKELGLTCAAKNQAEVHILFTL